MFSIFFPRKSNSKESPPRLDFRWLLRVVVLLTVVILLTWIAKFKDPGRMTSRTHGLVAWFLPTPQGISTYLIFPDDRIDTNNVRTGLRILLNPPQHLTPIAQHGLLYYEGPFVVIPDSGIAKSTLAEAKALAGPQEQLYTAKDLVPGWIRTLGGSDVQAQFSGSDHSHLDLQWNGYRLRWWKSVADLQSDSRHDSLSVGILEECISDLAQVPQIQDAKIHTWIYCGPESADSTRIALGKAGIAVGLVEGDVTLLIRKLHLEFPSH